MLHTEIDRLGDEDVAVLHRIALELARLSQLTRRVLIGV